MLARRFFEPLCFASSEVSEVSHSRIAVLNAAGLTGVDIYFDAGQSSLDLSVDFRYSWASQKNT